MAQPEFCEEMMLLRFFLQRARESDYSSKIQDLNPKSSKNGKNMAAPKK